MAALSLVPVTIASALVCGVILALAGALRRPLSERLQIAETQAGWLMVAMSIALVLLLPLAGMMVDSIGVEHMLIAGSALAALALSILALRDSFSMALGSAALVGAAGSCLAAASTVLMPLAFFPAVAAEGIAGLSTAAVNLGYVFVGLGVVLGPVVVDLFVRWLRWRRGLLLVALLCLTPALVAALTPAADFPNERPGEGARAWDSPLLWLAALLCLLYLPVEAAVSSWATSNLGGVGFTPRQARWLLAGFWCAFLGARLAAMLLVLWGTIIPGKEAWWLLGLALTVGVALGNLAGAARKTSIAWGLLLVGFFCGAIYPTLIGWVLARFRSEPGAAFAAVTALGWVGTLLLAPLIAYQARKTSGQRALRIPLLASLLLAAAALVLGLTF